MFTCYKIIDLKDDEQILIDDVEDDHVCKLHTPNKYYISNSLINEQQATV